MTPVLRLAAAFALVTLAVGSASAHPLHGTDFAGGLAHPFMGIDHLLAAVGVGMWAARLSGRSLWIVPAGFVSAMLVGCAMALAGYGAGAIEPMTAASVAVLGALLFWRLRSNAFFAAALVAYFAIFHGMAHAAELSGPASGFVVGLALSTAALHASGIAAARHLPAIVPYAGAALTGLGTWWVAASLL